MPPPPPPPTPTRLLVIQRLVAHLEGMTITTGHGHGNGLPHTMNGKVFRGRTHFADETEAPILSVLESPRVEENVSRGGENALVRVDSMVFIIQGFTEVPDENNPTDEAYHILAHTEERLAQLVAEDRNSGRPAFPDAYMLGRLVQNITLVQPVVQPPKQDGSSRFATFLLPIIVTLPYNPLTPFTDAA